jgi:hypothetical protein
MFLNLVFHDQLQLNKKQLFKFELGFRQSIYTFGKWILNKAALLILALTQIVR